jgi:ATP-dependent helicase HrpA
MAAVGSPQVAAALEDIGQQLAALVGPHFVSNAGLRRLPDVERYLTAVERRLERLPSDPRRDFALSQKVRSLELMLAEARAEAQQDEASPAQFQALDEVRWMIEELRVSFFAQSLGTRVPVSEERVMRALAALP